MMLVSIFSAGKHKSKGSFEYKTLIVITHHNDIADSWNKVLAPGP